MIVADKVVIAADIFGKIKTVSQMVCVIVVLIEPILFGQLIPVSTHNLLAYITVLFSALMTLLSGLNYFRSFWPYINPNK